MSTAKPSGEEAVAKALASGTEMTGAEIATATGLARSTVGKALASLERDGTTVSELFKVLGVADRERAQGATHQGQGRDPPPHAS